MFCLKVMRRIVFQLYGFCYKCSLLGDCLFVCVQGVFQRLLEGLQEGVDKSSGLGL